MKRSPRGQTSVRAFAVLLALGITGFWIPGRDADAAVGPYSGSAASDIVHVHAVNIPDAFELAEVAIAPSRAEVNSEGVAGGGRSHAHATNVDAEALSEAIDAELLVGADHRAPGGERGPVVSELLGVPADPLLNATVARATAHARWNNTGCVPVGTPISTGRSELADAQVLTGTPLGDALVAVHNDDGDTVYSESKTEHVNVAGTAKKGVRSTTLTQITGITLFEGTANQLTVNVVAPPVVTATATGKPGGATVTYSEPVLQVLDANGDVIGELNAVDANLEIDGLPLVKLRLGQLTSVTKSDGTEASGNAVLLEVIVLSAADAIEPLLRLTIVGGTVGAKVPSGGVDCGGGSDGGGGAGGGGDCAIDNPLKELQVGPSTLTAPKGSTFTYTKSVSNRGKCTLTNVKVVNDVNGPAGSEVTATAPEADQVDGSTVTWNDIGPLAPNQLKVLVVTVQVPSGAENGAKYTDETKVTATGGGRDYAKGVKVEGPTVGGAGSGACNLSQSKAGPSHKEVEPGETFNVYISLLNSGGAPCHATVTLPIDGDLEFVACTHNCTHPGRTITWVVDIDPGDGLTLTATLRTPDDAANGTVFHHTVTIRDGGTITRTADGPTVTGSSVLAPFPSAGGADVGGDAQLPRTGASILRLIAAALLLLVAGAAMREWRAGRSAA